METRTAIGQTLKVDDWRWHGILIDADGYNGAEFRVTLPMLEISVPIRITITGRKVRWDAPMSGGGVRVRVEFLDDENAPESAGAWMSWSELQDGSIRLNPNGR